MIVRPLGRITSIDASTLDAAYPSGHGIGVLGTKEILRATTVRIDNQSDLPIVVRLLTVGALDTATGEAYSLGHQINIETFNHYDMIIKPAETAYVSKRPTATVFDDPDVPTYVEIPPAPAETIQIRLAPGIAPGAATGFIYASPVSITG